MQVDELRAALREAAAGQPPVSPTARRDIRRRVLVRRVAGAALVVAVAGAGVGVAVTATGHQSAQGTRVVSQPGATTSIAPTPTTGPASPGTTLTTVPNGVGLPTPTTLPPELPAGFAVRSVTFVSATEGWALGDASCSVDATSCAAVLAHTIDGGKTWARVPAPPTNVVPVPYAGPHGVWQVRFADSLDGWAYGPDLWTTHDGGYHWSKSSLLSDVYALEASAGTVHAVVFNQTSPSFQMASSPINEDAWTIWSTGLEVGAGPIPSIQLVLQGSTGWIVENDRTVVAGARLVAGRWQPWTPPCKTAGGPAYLAASDSTHLVADCTEGVYTGPAIADHVYWSTDGGTTFTRIAAAVPAPNVSGISSPAPDVAFVPAAIFTQTSVVPQIFGSFNGGATWRVVYPGQNSQRGITLVGFTTPTQGVAITGSGELLMTHDGGHSWATVNFG